MNIISDDLSAALIQSTANLQETKVLQLVQRRIERDDDPMDIVEDCRKGMVLVGERYEKRQYYLAGLILAGEILREVTEMIQPQTERKYSGKSLSRILLGTVEGDIHDAGKDLFQMMLSVHGFTVFDLGVNVPPVEFLENALELRPAVIGLSCLISGAYPSMKETIEILRAEPKIAPIPIIIGGQVNAEICQFVRADHWSVDAMEGVRWCQEYVTEKKLEIKVYSEIQSTAPLSG